jgi:hypothetical protein
MSSKAHRLKVRAQRRRNRPNTVTALAPHAEVAMHSLAGMLDGILRFARSGDPLVAIDVALAELVDQLAARFCGVDPTRAIEVARLACLPWSHDGRVPAGSQVGPTQAELIALIAITTACREDSNSDAQSQDEPAPITEVINEAAPLIDRILELVVLC